jgi:ribA/ribD-fused uncharacterized protein
MNPLYDEIGINGAPHKKDDWTLVAVHSEEEVHGFFGPYRFLSNMWPAEVHFEGHVYPSVENAYQAAKFAPEERVDFLTCTPKEAKKFSIGRAMQYAPEEWDEKRNEIMFNLLKEKFDPKVHSDLSEQLKDTGVRNLEETNWWGDVYWGVCEGKGENTLGKMLMDVRGSL